MSIVNNSSLAVFTTYNLLVFEKKKSRSSSSSFPLLAPPWLSTVHCASSSLHFMTDHNYCLWGTYCHPLLYRRHCCIYKLHSSIIKIKVSAIFMFLLVNACVLILGGHVPSPKSMPMNVAVSILWHTTAMTKKDNKNFR